MNSFISIYRKYSGSRGKKKNSNFLALINKRKREKEMQKEFYEALAVLYNQFLNQTFERFLGKSENLLQKEFMGVISPRMTNDPVWKLENCFFFVPLLHILLTISRHEKKKN